MSHTNSPSWRSKQRLYCLLEFMWMIMFKHSIHQGSFPSHTKWSLSAKPRSSWILKPWDPKDIPYTCQHYGFWDSRNSRWQLDTQSNLFDWRRESSDAHARFFTFYKDAHTDWELIGGSVRVLIWFDLTWPVIKLIYSQILFLLPLALMTIHLYTGIKHQNLNTLDSSSKRYCISHSSRCSYLWISNIVAPILGDFLYNF